MAFAGLALLAGCSSVPDSFPVPPQRRDAPAPRYSHLRSFVSMSDWDAAEYLVQDVSAHAGDNTWRWTFRHPGLRFYLTSTERLKFVMDFAIAERTFEQTGPVILAIFVNGKLLERKRCQQPGPHHLEYAVPPVMLRPNAVNNVRIEADKVWISPADGTALGFILVRAGFTN